MLLQTSAAGHATFLYGRGPTPQDDDADAITRWLKPRLRHRDAVVALSPCDGPLKSSFIRHRVPTEWLHDYWVSRAQRIFIAVERSSGQTVGSVMESLRIPLSPGVVPRLLLNLGDSSLYVYEREGSSTTTSLPVKGSHAVSRQSANAPGTQR